MARIYAIQNYVVPAPNKTNKTIQEFFNDSFDLINNINT